MRRSTAAVSSGVLALLLPLVAGSAATAGELPVPAAVAETGTVTPATGPSTVTAVSARELATPYLVDAVRSTAAPEVPSPVTAGPGPAAPPAAVAAPVAATPGPDTCGAALAYLDANAAPGFTFECPGYALGHQAMTCMDVAGHCAGIKLIAIATVCPASYMNEASNSWVMTGRRHAPIDPYGFCH